MNGRFVLDTNAVIALVDGNVAVRDLVNQADEVFVPSPVLGELYFGAFHSGRVIENVGRVDELVRWYAILSIDAATAKIYGMLRTQLRVAGGQSPITTSGSPLSHNNTARPSRREMSISTPSKTWLSFGGRRRAEADRALVIAIKLVPTGSTETALRTAVSRSTPWRCSAWA